MIRAIGYLLSEAFRSLVHRLFDDRVTWDHDDDPDLDADTAARTRWVRERRHPEGG